MPLKDLPIQRKLMTILLLITGATLTLTCLAFVAYEYVSFRAAAIHNLATLGRIIANNSTASLAFDNREDAQQVLSALKAEPHIDSAALYDSHGVLFARYRAASGANSPNTPLPDGYRYEASSLIGVEPVQEGTNRRLGSLYLRSDLGALHEQLTLYSLIAATMTGLAFVVAYLLSRLLQQQISGPIQMLAGAARAVSEQRDYSVRVSKIASDELGNLTDAFNEMLEQIHSRDQDLRQSEGRLRAQLTRLDLLHRITRAIGERQDLRSLFQVVIRRLEDNLPIDFGCVFQFDAVEQLLIVTSLGSPDRALAAELGLSEQERIPVDRNGLGRCVQGELVYEPDISASPFPFASRLARGGLRSLVISPLLAEGKVVAVLVAARLAAHAFESGDCEFLRQLGEHVGLAAQQIQLYGALHQSYEDLRQSQQAVLQQERLRALGQIASGVAHDINNAISPVALYADSLLETEPALSDRARKSLTIIQQCIHDVAQTVSRMRDFYRKREPQVPLASVDLNQIIPGVVEFTRSRWRDVPQERGVVIDVRTELASQLPKIQGIDSEVRDALTNLILNAVDAMPDGGTLTLRTRPEGARRQPRAEATGKPRSDSLREAQLAAVCLEVSDTGIGMTEETRRRCLEPFFTTKGERGTGMGLAMVYGMVERHGAELEIDSAYGKGTTIRLIFPVAAAVVDQGGSQPVLQQPSGPLRILIVDDDPLIIESLSETLRGDGHRVTATDGGQAGIDAFLAANAQGKGFDAVITDLGMPYVDGRRVAAAVKSTAASTPVIMLTGWGQRLSADDELPPHVDRVLNKPPKLRDVRQALAEFRNLGLK
jgi:signal transduction histidine kinase/ActR/RegA family two-component response regulator/HAMP domain-containing protein